MLVEWLIFGGIIFYAILAILTVVFILCIHNDCEGSPIVMLALFLAAWFLVGDMKSVFEVKPMLFLWYPLAYLGIGLSWCIPQWIVFLDRIKRRYAKELKDFKVRNGIAEGIPIPEKHWSNWGDNLYGFRDSGLSFNTKTGVLTPPQFSSNKKHISSWVILWPWSMLDTLLGDIVMRFVDWAVGLHKRMFQAISNWMFKDFK
jgi:hypothetical protein